LLGSPGCLLGVTPARCGPCVGSPVARQAGPDPDAGGSDPGSNESWLTDPSLASQTRRRSTSAASTILGRHSRRKSSPKIPNPSPWFSQVEVPAEETEPPPAVRVHRWGYTTSELSAESPHSKISLVGYALA
jgi:hypothetical protein